VGKAVTGVKLFESFSQRTGRGGSFEHSGIAYGHFLVSFTCPLIYPQNVNSTINILHLYMPIFEERLCICVSLRVCASATVCMYI
jgi:hypothetical protein